MLAPMSQNTSSGATVRAIQAAVHGSFATGCRRLRAILRLATCTRRGRPSQSSVATSGRRASRTRCTRRRAAVGTVRRMPTTVTGGAVVLFWDVDGTLLTTARAGVFSLEDALEQVTGVRADLQGMATA